jgi:hypothetical protein
VCIIDMVGGQYVILCLYIEDILIFGINIDIINKVKSFLTKSFDMKDLGEALFCQRVPAPNFHNRSSSIQVRRRYVPAYSSSTAPSSYSTSH